MTTSNSRAQLPSNAYYTTTTNHNSNYSQLGQRNYYPLSTTTITTRNLYPATMTSSNIIDSKAVSVKPLLINPKDIDNQHDSNAFKKTEVFEKEKSEQNVENSEKNIVFSE